MRIRADGHRNSRVAKRSRRADSIGEIAFGRRADATRRAARLQQGNVVVRQVGRVHRGEPIAEHTLTVEQFDRRATVHRDGLLVLRRLLADMGVQRRIVGGGPAGNDRHRRCVHTANGVDGCADRGGVGPDEVIDSLRPCFGVAVIERCCVSLS